MAARTPLIAGNWKMYKTCDEAVAAATRLAQLVGDAPAVEVMIAPPFTALYPVCRAVKGSRVSVGAQNLFWENEGAYTGEVSAAMILSTGCTHVIIGHSERRQYFGETDDGVNRKVLAAIEAGLVPVMCVGETEDERDAGRTFSVLDKQVRKGLENVSSEAAGRLVVAYEPVWAIGTGKTATAEQAQEAHNFIRGLLKKDFGTARAQTVRILYGGSVKPGNAAELMALEDVDGGLVGGASLDPEVFIRIVNYSKG